MENNNGFVTKFFQYLDTPLMIFIFEADEFILGVSVYMSLMIIFATLGIVIKGGVLIYALTAIITMYGYMRFKKNKPNGYTFQRLYKLGIFEPRFLGLLSINKKKQKAFKVLPYGFTTRLTGN
jgi:hypothetical protein